MDSLCEEDVGERLNLCWTKCRVLNVGLITRMVYGCEDLITMMRRYLSKGFVSVNKDKENGC